MLYESVDNYHHTGKEDNSYRLNNTEDLNDFTSQSIVCAMDRFVKSVNNMNETIMVPCRLLDVDVQATKPDTKVPKLLKKGNDAYGYYSILNSVKNDLIWGPSSNDDDDDEDLSIRASSKSTRWTGTNNSSSPPKSNSSSSSKKEKANFRRTSSVSLRSVSSNTSEGDSESSESNTEDEESDEGNGSVVSSNSAADSVTAELKSHLVGLHSCLKNLTETANYITDCYQEQISTI